MTTEPWEVLRSRRPTSAEHRCKLPRFRARRRLRLKVGALAKCKECGRVWEWTATSYDTFRSWCPIGWAEGARDGLSESAVTDAAPQPDADHIVAEGRAQL